MSRRRLPVFLALLLSLIVPLLIPAASARQPAAVSTPEAAAVFYSQLEAAGSFSALYRYLHPDAQSFIPEAAVVGWYTNEFVPNGPGVITVTGMQMMSWTWEVTGTTYPDIAVVSFRQPFANGTVVEDVVRLVESNGEWRWFFGRSRTFVDEQIAKYGSALATSGDQCAGASEWWAGTYPRLLLAEYFSNAFGLAPSNDSAASDKYSHLFMRLYDEQVRSSPPPAAAILHTEVLSILDTYFGLALSLAALDDSLARERFQEVSEDGKRQLLNIDTTIEGFINTCQPLVVVVYGMGEDDPMSVLPGEVGPRIPVIDCSMFPTQAEAQRFFEAAQPGDPHRLDTDSNGRACMGEPASSASTTYPTPTPPAHGSNSGNTSITNVYDQYPIKVKCTGSVDEGLPMLGQQIVTGQCEAYAGPYFPSPYGPFRDCIDDPNPPFSNPVFSDHYFLCRK